MWLERTSPRRGDADEEHDDANSRFLDECREEERRIERLLGDERLKAKRRLKPNRLI